MKHRFEIRKVFTEADSFKVIKYFCIIKAAGFIFRKTVTISAAAH